MSLEWSRLFPNPTDDAEGYQQLAVLADQAAVDHYHEVFAALRERNLIPLVTLHHYTMPAWLHDGVSCHFDLEQCENRGWVDRERAVREITKYAGFVAREFAGEVDLWATQNEPFAVVLPGYLLPSPERVNPPSVTLAEEAARTAMVAMIEAHARMVEAVRTSDRIDADGDGAATSIGLVYAMAPVVPRNPEDAVDVRAAENVFYLWNLVFLDAVILGQLDADMSGEPVYRSDLEVPMDWLGINYKVRARVRGAPRSAFPEVSPLLTVDPTSIDFTEVHAAGLYQMIELVHQRYALPVIITENNGQNVPTGDIELEIRYVVENMSWMMRAIEDGFDVRGYFYWTLMDNYEWNQGMTGKPLGLYAVDGADPLKLREPRAIADVFAEVAAARSVPANLAERYPIRRRSLTE